MKRFLVITLVFGLAFFSCDSGNGNSNNNGGNGQNPFKGSWKSETVPLPNGNGIITLVVNDTTWEYSSTVNYGQKGTYTFTGNNATMTITHQTFDGVTWSNDLTGLPFTNFTGSLSGNTMVANEVTLTKQ